jgi:hypothetical protein
MMARNVLVFVLLSVLSSSVFSLERKVFCIWDPVGRNGPVMSFYSDVIPKAQAWGLSIRFVAYTDERIAAADFKAGRCEAVLLTSILARQFVKFGGTMDAIGAINSQEGLETALNSLARPKAGQLMTEGDYEVIGTFPVGSMYAFVNDRSINTIEKFSGKSISILNGDPQMKKFAALAGASQVGVTLDSFAGRFNRGEVDIVVMPALAYNTFELYHGLGSKGGIIDKRLYYGMLQAISKRDQFPEGFGHTMRNYLKTRLKAINKLVKDAEEEIPEKSWIETSQFVKDDIDYFSKRVRIALMEDGVNHPKALHLFWKIRCRLDRSRGECKESPVNVEKRDQKYALKAAASNKQNKLVKDKQTKLAQKKLAKQKLEQKALVAQKLERKKQSEQALAKKKFAEQEVALEREKIERAKIEAELEHERTEREKLEKELLALGNKNKALQADVSMQAEPQVVGEQGSEPASQEEPEEESRWWQIF